jgi:hypothetical protein
LVLNAPDWLTWLPPFHPLAAQSKLYIIEGGRPYLIKLADNAVPVNWIVRGTPVIRKPDWLAASLNLVGSDFLISRKLPWDQIRTAHEITSRGAGVGLIIQRWRFRNGRGRLARRSTVSQLINQTQLSRGKHRFGGGEFFA